MSDCESRDSWFFAQDTNAWTSLAFVAVGAAIIAVGRRVHRAYVVLGIVVVVEGIGSVLYHGEPSDAARVVHDAALLAALGFVAGWHLGRYAAVDKPRSFERWALVGLTCGGVAGVAGGMATAATTNAFAAIAVVVIVVSESMARHRGLPGVWNAPLIAVMVVGLATWLAGTPDSPLCAEDSWFQAHGLWHITSALVLLLWMDRAVAAHTPQLAPRMVRRTTDRAFGQLAKVLTHAFYRSVQVAGRERLPRDRPVLIVANHGNGFVDPVVVAAVLGRLPRFLAKAALWRVAVARPFLALAGVLPVYRSGDGDQSSENVSVFDACHRELDCKATVAIFPEGTTGDRAALDRVRAGAARIALGSVATAPDLVIVPIGLAFESRVETRSRTVVMIGQPIEMKSRPSSGESDVGAVRELTAAISSALHSVSPEFESVEEREVLRASARSAIAAERTRGEATFGEVEILARQLAGAPPAARAAITDAFQRYATSLQLAGLTDRQFAGSATSAVWVMAAILAMVVLGSLVATAVLIHLPALLLVVVATGAVRSTATKGTVRLLVGLVAGLLTWVIAGIVLADGFGAVLAGALIAVEGAIALAVLTPLKRAFFAVLGWLQRRDRAGLLDPVVASRDALVAAVRSASYPVVGHGDDPGTIARASS